MIVPKPVVTPVTWTSFMTGANPRTHGIFGRRTVDVRTLEERLLDFEDCRIPTLFERLGSLDRRSVVINQPFTYPARKINGAIG